MDYYLQAPQCTDATEEGGGGRGEGGEGGGREGVQPLKHCVVLTCEGCAELEALGESSAHESHSRK